MTGLYLTLALHDQFDRFVKLYRQAVQAGDTHTAEAFRKAALLIFDAVPANYRKWLYGKPKREVVIKPVEVKPQMNFTQLQQMIATTSEYVKERVGVK